VNRNTSLDPAVVRGNAKRLRVVVDNLLSNATKHTPRGGQIDVQLRSVNGLATLDVRDSGPGVAEEDEPYLFEWFFSGRQPPDSVVAGTGMGLAIAREYAEQHGGNLTLLETMSGAHFRLSIGSKQDDHA
jgi:two-component system sensor histidine kinase GlrK